MKSIITSDDILGKDVVDVDGEIIGVVQQLQIDKDSKQIVGILVDQGFMKPDIFIGFKYVKNLGVDSIFLNSSPKPKIKGLEVYDSNGKMLGSVHGLIEENNLISAIIFSKSQFSKSYLVKSKFIKTIGFSIILRKPDSEVAKLAVKTSDRGLKFFT